MIEKENIVERTNVTLLSLLLLLLLYYNDRKTKIIINIPLIFQTQTKNCQFECSFHSKFRDD
jgi:hypothetical protein